MTPSHPGPHHFDTVQFFTILEMDGSYLCLSLFNTTRLAMEERNNGSKSKKRLEFMLGQSRTSYAAWNRQAEVNLKPHPLHWRWINDDVMPDLTEPEFDIPQWVVVGGVREQIVHPNNYRIEALRGRQVRYLDPRWAPRGAADVVYETLTEREQNICNKRYEKGVDAADRTRRSFPELSADWQLTIDRRKSLDKDGDIARFPCQICSK